jgi:iron complex transport system permease protein
MTFMQKKKHYKTAFTAGVIILLLAGAGAAALGTASISFSQTVLIMLSRIPLINTFVSLQGIKETSVIIILNLRLPRIILASLVGAGLSVVGTSFQGIFKNPMADPYILGISSGAALGATLAVVSGIETSVLGMSFTAICAFSCAIVTTAVVYNIAKIGNKVPVITLLLSGIAISSFISSIISLIMTFRRDNIERIVMWTLGGLNAANWDQVKLVFPAVVITTLVLYMFSRDLNIMLLGEESAKNLGVEVEKVKKIILVLCTLMVAAVVSVSGIIGFAGLIIPHAVRMLFGADNRIVIPFSALGGAIFLIICDTIARSLVPPVEIPLGIVTSIFGVPFFIYLLYRSKKKVL